MKDRFRTNLLAAGVIFLAALAVLTATVPVRAGGNPPDDPILSGVAVFKVFPQFKVDLPVEGAPRFGAVHIDRFMERIGATWVKRKYPHCLPPKPGGADLTRTYVLSFPSHLDVRDVCRRLAKLDGVEFAEPWFVQHIFLEHNDEFRDRQYALDLLQANLAHDISTGDPDVVIAIVDNGTDMDHPDLVDNIYVNPGEDLNGDGEIQPNERNGRDDDDNGFIDDFHGWDFSGNGDNDPDDSANHGHGTHTAGIASAVTNNHIGIASVGYSCSIMPVRVGSGARITAGYEGIEYAARMGVEVINCSWGGRQAGRNARDVINYAWDQDVVIVCAAGNSNNTSRLYPAAFENAIAVAATDQDDHKANFSSYGDWVDVSAPGVDIYSTTVNGQYRYWEGTSMASPYAASVAALIRAEFPEINNRATRLLLIAGAEDIDDENPNFRGRLGAGRVNALRALHGVDQPLLELQAIELAGEDNGNGRVDPGERGYFTVTLSNLGQTAEDIVVQMTTDDEDIEVVIGEVLFPDIGIGETYTNDDDPLIIEVDRNTISHTATFTIRVTAQPGDIELTRHYDLLIGHPAILIVDDDDGADYEQVFEESVRRMHMGYLRWDVLRDDTPVFDVLTDHAIVIWLTGNAFPPLDDNDRWSMINAVNEGANILLMGKWVGDVPADQPFLRQYFGAGHQQDSVAAEVVVGMPGERPVPPEVRVALFDPEGEDSLDARISPSHTRVRWGADTLMVYQYHDNVTGIAGVYQINRDTGAHTIYLGFSLEMAADCLTPRPEMMAYLFDWFTDYRSAPLPDGDEPVTFLLEPSYPNPFNGVARLNFSLARGGLYRLSVIDLSGREVAVLREGIAPAGRYTTAWDAADMPSGTYFARLSSPGRAMVEQRLVLVR